MKKLLTLLAGFCLTSLYLHAQETFPRNDVMDKRAHAYAFTHATIVMSPDKTIESGTLLIRDGKIESVGADVAIPSGYTTVDLNGKYVYPSFIDVYTNYGLPKVQSGRRGRRGGPEQIESKTKGAYNANQAIKSHYQAAEAFAVDDKTAAVWRKLGFGAVLSFNPDGVARGTSALVSLAKDRPNEVMLNKAAAAHYSFNKGTSTQSYPVSSMGYISLLRQTYLDAEWYASQQPRPFMDQSLEAWISQQDLPQIFEASNWMTALRADKVGDEFGVQYIIKAGGNEYQRMDEIKASKATFILPLNFPDAYEVEDPLDAEQVSLRDMKHWEMAPANPAYFQQNEINFVLTTHGLKNKQQFMSNLRKAIKHGLSKEKALAALTTGPASLLGMADHIGSLEKGKIANFIISSGEIFESKTVIYQNWIQGKSYHLNEMNVRNFAGAYDLRVGDEVHKLMISGEAGKHKAHILVNDSTKKNVNLKLDGEWATLSFQTGKKKESIRLSGWWEEKGQGWKGKGQQVDGQWVSWQAMYKEATMADNKGKAKKGQGKSSAKPELGELIYPFLPFGSTAIPKQETILIKGATVWTNEASGILENADVLIENGKIKKIGKNISKKGARMISGVGKHLTSGIIDEHSHVGGGGNEILANSSLVRITDQINSEDINIYRALAGGVTAIQVLHGSANPIGGQSALIKLRWGHGPEALRIKGADEYIKFALGENVKRSRNDESIRYPQTRMGVEQVYVDAFANAREYEKSWKEYNALSVGRSPAPAIKPRRDLTQEAMLKILNEEMFITCHSYVQSEINMLMDVADRFDFRVNTFTHILEGYKVADKMKAHGVGASTFSDWWNYKWEVRYAIPYNAAIMHREGVVTAINSDSGELMRRLNSEAAKAVKYGGIPEQDAWKMVTLNPAKLLHLEDRMGSLKVGKDGDVVLWSDHPMSIYAKAEKTIIDGTVFFDLEKDKQLREYVRLERARLIQKMKDAKKSGAPSRRRGSSYELNIHCDDVLGQESEHTFEHH